MQCSPPTHELDSRSMPTHGSRVITGVIPLLSSEISYVVTEESMGYLSFNGVLKFRQPQ
uniref:Uncharacterized protein n=1 Tax=Picea sitchensis TaxID=3332 RepID=A0A6B9XXG1_PICSI|nr:hypothetical protein Q903MT_gene6888 [Picea sitchensis]